MQGTLAGMKGMGKGRTGNENEKGIPNPIMYMDAPNLYAEWRATLLAYMRPVANPNVDQWVAWARLAARKPWLPTAAKRVEHMTSSKPLRCAGEEHHGPKSGTRQSSKTIWTPTLVTSPEL